MEAEIGVPETTAAASTEPAPVPEGDEEPGGGSSAAGEE